MPTTPYGLHYPSSTAPPNVPADLQLLAQDVEAVFKSPWTTFASTVVGVARYRVIGSIVFVHIDGTLTTVSGTSYTISTAPLPAAVRPTGGAYRSGAYFAGYPGTLSVIQTGDVLAIQISAANRGSICGIVSYPLG